MFIDINKIGPDGLDFDVDPGLDGLLDATGAELPVSHARIAGRADPGPDGVILEGSVAATLAIACSRCLARFDHAFRSDFSLRVIADAVEPESPDTEVGEEEARIFHAEGGILRLDDVAREQVYLGLPLKPVCEVGCRGLCPRCGENRNEAECGCREEEIDPRLAPLMEFKRQRSGP